MASGALDDVTGTQRDDIQTELDQMRGGQDVELELERLKGEIGGAPKREIESGPWTARWTARCRPARPPRPSSRKPVRVHDRPDSRRGPAPVDDSATDELNVLDAALEKAVNAGDERAFRPALAALLDRVRSLGTPLAEDALEPSDLILPYSDAGLEDVRELITGEGLIPG